MVPNSSIDPPFHHQVVPAPGGPLQARTWFFFGRVAMRIANGVIAWGYIHSSAVVHAHDAQLMQGVCFCFHSINLTYSTVEHDGLFYCETWRIFFVSLNRMYCSRPAAWVVPFRFLFSLYVAFDEHWETFLCNWGCWYRLCRCSTCLKAAQTVHRFE